MKDIEAVWCASSARSDLGALGVREDVVVLLGGAREGPVLGLGRVVGRARLFEGMDPLR